MVEAGETDGLAPPETRVPPQLPVYQSTVTPPGTVAERVEEAPAQIEAGVATGEVGVDGIVLTVTATLAQPALVHPELMFRARAKYMVVPDGDTFSPDPLPTSVPPHEAVYQSIVSPAPTVAVNEADEPAQTDEGVASWLVGVAGVPPGQGSEQQVGCEMVSVSTRHPVAPIDESLPNRQRN